MKTPDEILAEFVEATNELTQGVAEIEPSLATPGEATEEVPRTSHDDVLRAIADVEKKLASLQQILDAAANAAKN